MRWWHWLLVCWLTFDVAFLMGAWWATRGAKQREDAEKRAAIVPGRQLRPIRNLP